MSVADDLQTSISVREGYFNEVLSLEFVNIIKRNVSDI